MILTLGAILELGVILTGNRHLVPTTKDHVHRFARHSLRLTGHLFVSQADRSPVATKPSKG